MRGNGIFCEGRQDSRDDNSGRNMPAGEVEYRNLTEKELALCTRAAMPGGLRLKDADMDLVEALHKKGLLYLEVPIRPDDHVSIPPLEVLRPHTQSDRECLRGIAQIA